MHHETTRLPRHAAFAPFLHRLDRDRLSLPTTARHNETSPITACSNHILVLEHTWLEILRWRRQVAEEAAAGRILAPPLPIKRLSGSVRISIGNPGHLSQGISSRFVERSVFCCRTFVADRHRSYTDIISWITLSQWLSIEIPHIACSLSTGLTTLRYLTSLCCLSIGRRLASIGLQPRPDLPVRHNYPRVFGECWLRIEGLIREN